MKKLLSKGKLMLMLMMVFMLTLTACSDEKETKEKESSKEDGNKVEETAQPAATVQPTKEPRNPNVLNLANYKYYEKSDTEDVYLLAELSVNSQGEGEYFNSCEILNISAGNILAKCDITSMSVDEEGVSQFDMVSRILLINKDSMKIEKEITVEDEYTIKDKKNIFLVASNKKEESKGTIYNNELEIIGEYSIENAGDVCVNETGENAYYVKDKLLYKYNIKTQETTHITINEECVPSFVSQVVTTDNGEDYITVNAVFTDYLTYVAVINPQTGDVMYIEDSNVYSNVDNNVYCLSGFGNMSEAEWIVALDDKTQWKFTLEDQYIQVNCMILDNGDVSYSYTEDDTVIIELFDGETGALIGIQKIKVPCKEVEVSDEYDGEPVTKAYLSDTPQYINENTLMISIENIDMEVRYYIWNLKSAQEEGIIKSQKYEMGEKPSREIECSDIVLYVPEELNPDLLPLKERTDELEEQYGLEIYIGEECGGYSGGYSVYPYLNYDNVEDAVETVESALEKYPLAFFGQFESDYVDGISLYLAGNLVGVDAQVLDTASGFKVTEDSRILIYLNCEQFETIQSTFHHELAHAIDEKIQNADMGRETPLLSDEEWEKFNPKTGMYTMTYDEFGYGENSIYVYEDSKHSDTAVENTYFVDYYAMTYPTEDRARMFESVMSSEIYDVDFDRAPYLKAKLNYYADCIRATFDTTGWGEVGWEAYK